MKLDLGSQYGFAALPINFAVPGEGGVPVVAPGEGGVVGSAMSVLQKLSAKIGAGEGGRPPASTIADR
jgi:hypothetical protein